MGVGVLGLRVSELGFRVQNLGLRVYALVVQDLGFRFASRQRGYAVCACDASFGIGAIALALLAMGV